jgi:co-chaperonin GroES (HSP10)
MKNQLGIAVALLCSTLSFNSLAAGKVAPGSKIYVDAQDGFDTYLTAALQKKHVPVTIVEDKEKADYVLSGVSEHQKPGWAKTLALGQIHSDDQASVKLVDIKSGEVVFAYAVNKKNTVHGRQTVAEACAKHLKEAMAGKD